MARGEIHVQLAVNHSRDPKMRALVRYGRDARACRDLYVQMICYCKETLSDGFVPVEELGALVLPDPPRYGKRDADRLVEVGLIEVVDGGYYVPAFLKRNKSKAQVEAESAKKAANGRAGGRRSGETRRRQANAKHDASNGEPNAKHGASHGFNTEDRGHSHRSETEAPPPPNPPDDDDPWDEPAAQAGEGDQGTDIDDFVDTVRGIRPDWSSKSIRRALTDPRVRERAPELVLAAMIAVARDPNTQQPGRLAADGPWWHHAAKPKLAPAPEWCGKCSPCRRLEDADGGDLGPCPTCHPSTTARPA